MKKIVFSFIGTAIVAFGIIYSLIPELPVTKHYSEQSELVKFDNTNDKNKILLPVYVKVNDVPFVAQAPFAEWEDIRQQEACEEASILMAMYWSLDKPLSKKIAKNEILNMVNYQDEKLGYFIHTDIEDTNLILTDYYNFKNSKIIDNAKIVDIKKALASDKLVVAPMNGKTLKNPNFLNGGPENHMILIIGYDDNKSEFITHDPGTRNGSEYRYSYKTIEESFKNYHSSKSKNLIPEKSIIVISK